MAFLKEKLEIEVAEAELEAKKMLSGFGPKQKGLFIFCLVMIIPAYITVKETVLHVDLGKYRRNELAATAAFQNPQAPQISAMTITQSGAGIYSVAAQITNPNLTLSLDNVSYNFLLFNAQSQQVGSSQAILYLLPGETKYLILPKFQTAETIAGAQIQFPQNLPWQKRLDIPSITLSASTPTTQNQQSPSAFVVQGTVYNNSPYQLNEVDIAFILKDATGKIVAASSRAEFTFGPFERRAYVQLWPNVYSTNIATVDVYPETDVLNSSNITLPATPVTPASDLSR
jgi:hypothetical protein